MQNSTILKAKFTGVQRSVARWTIIPAILLLTLFAPSIARADAPAPNRSQAKFEIRFMTEMIDHHAMAVAMAMICTNKAVHPELEQLCENVITAQSAEIEQMQTWLRDWYGVEHEPEMTAGDERQMEKLAALNGAEFEIAFMRMLIRHHAIAIVRAQNCVRRAFHQELIQMCHDIVQAQTSEIQTLETWLCQWYGICHGGHGNGKPGH